MPAENYAVRIRVPFETLRSTVSSWALKAERILAYEHPEPDNIHCHLLLYGVRDTSDNLKKIMWKHGVDAHGAGQVSFKTTFKDTQKNVVGINDETIPKYITYMSKGKYDPKYFNHYTEAYLGERKEAWVDYKRCSSHEQLYKEFIIWLATEKKIFVLMSLTLKQLKFEAIDFVKVKHGVISLPARRDAAMIIATYRWEIMKDHDIKLPFE